MNIAFLESKLFFSYRANVMFETKYSYLFTILFVFKIESISDTEVKVLLIKIINLNIDGIFIER